MIKAGSLADSTESQTGLNVDASENRGYGTNSSPLSGSIPIWTVCRDNGIFIF